MVLGCRSSLDWSRAWAARSIVICTARVCTRYRVADPSGRIDRRDEDGDGHGVTISTVRRPARCPRSKADIVSSYRRKTKIRR